MIPFSWADAHTLAGEAAKKIGFQNYQTLSTIEEGIRKLKAYELANLAKIYLRDISYFLNPNINIEEVETNILWRTRREDSEFKIKERK